MIKHLCSNCIFLTIFAVDFDCVGGKLERRSTLVCLRKPEVLHLTISAQHVHIQHWKTVRGEGKEKERDVLLTGNISKAVHDVLYSSAVQARQGMCKDSRFIIPVTEPNLIGKTP